jgi:type VI secretion system protein ImpF
VPRRSVDRGPTRGPREPADPHISREESARRFRQSVLRDLDWLLNTRRTSILADAEGQLHDSVYEFGLRDFSGMSTSTADWRQRLLDDVQDAIRRFEPRLANVNVELSDASANPATHQVRFVISATLLMDPSPEQVVFDTLLEVASGTYQVESQD